MKEYIFIRDEGFYTIPLHSPDPSQTDDEYAYANAECNKGTIQVFDLDHNIIFPKEDSDTDKNINESNRFLKMKICKVESCENKHFALGYCYRHYRQFKKYGSSLTRTNYDKNDYVIEDDIVRMNCYNNNNEYIGNFIFDLEDLEKVIKYKWQLTNTGYIKRTDNCKSIFLHQYLMNDLDNTDDNKLVWDFKNQNKCDIRKCNLRKITQRLNIANRPFLSNNKLGYKGVCMVVRNNIIRFQAQIKYKGKHIYLGKYKTVEEAHSAYEKKSRELHGEYYTDNI